MSGQHPDIADVSAAPRSADARSRRWRSLSLWVVSFLLFLPFYYPYVTHFVYHPPGLLPTGFIQPDQPYYAANAREHFDDGSFHLFYGLPFSPFYGASRIYFQPQTLVMGVAMHFTGLDPAAIYLLLGVVFGVICCRLALTLFERLFGLRTVPQWLTAIGFIWGGGLLVAVGTLKFIGTGDLNDLFAYDPFGGMWFLNFGRNLIYPHEAYYHAVWLAATICLLRRRYWAALALVAVASASHPFTGLQLICAILAWAALERFWIRNHDIPIGFIGGICTLLLLHLGYYLWFLNLFIEHRLVQQQWVQPFQDWTYEARHFVPAYALVGLLTVWAIRTPTLARTVFSAPFSRLLAVWMAVSFALANNEFALQPNIQPLHFTRGYVWMPLYILGAPTLILGLRWLLDRRRRVPAIAGAALVMAALFADNAVFLATFHWRTRVSHEEMWIPPGFRELAKFLSQPDLAGSIVLTPVPQGCCYDAFPYLLTTYTPLRMWHSHGINTPLSRQRYNEMADLFTKGEFLPMWSTMTLLVIGPVHAVLPDWLTARAGRRVYANQTFAVYRIDPAPIAPSRPLPTLP